MKINIEIDLDQVMIDEFIPIEEHHFYHYLKDLVKAEDIIKDKIKPLFKNNPEIMDLSGKLLIDCIDAINKEVNKEKNSKNPAKFDVDEIKSKKTL